MGPAAFHAAREALTPTSSVYERVWERILQGIFPSPALPLLERIRGYLTPSIDIHSFLKYRFLLRLQPVHSASGFSRRLAWVTAIALVVVGSRATLHYSLAPRSIAESPVMFTAVEGPVSLLGPSGLSHVVQNNQILQKSAIIQTGPGGSATLSVHDDVVVRIGENAVFAVHELVDLPHASNADSTFTLHAGTIWVQGFVPSTFPGITVATTQGLVEVNEGSVSITQGKGDIVDVLVLDRRGSIVRDGQGIPLLAGEQVQLWAGNIPTVRKITPVQYEGAWIAQNLKRDAVHRREIAQLQHERRAAQAGRLPTSTLYPVKRVAEKVDVLLTVGEEAKAEKRLAQAENRLNEAAALLAEGQTDVSDLLQEYSDTVLDVATGSGGGSVVHQLIEDQLVATTADVAALLPRDGEAYQLKEAVLQVSAALPDGSVTEEDVEAMHIVDRLASLKETVQGGDLTSAQETLAELTPTLEHLQNDVSLLLSDEVREEAEATLAVVASTLNDATDEGAAELKDEVRQYLPSPRLVISAEHTFSPEEMQGLIDAAIYRAFVVVHSERAQENQVRLEMRAFYGNPNEGNFIRHFYEAIPKGTSPDVTLIVQRRMRQLQIENAAQKEQ